MNLLVFDLDGTLTRTNDVDTQCFVQAVSDVLRIDNVNTNWEEYEHTTDLGCLQQLFRERFDREIHPHETSRLIDHFINLLRTRHAADSILFEQIPGAAALLDTLRSDSRWLIAIATGAWEPSARFKVAAAGISLEGLPAAFASDGPSREAIIRVAIERAGRRFDRIVSIGDAIWDVRTAARLHLPFVGIAQGARADELHNGGASHTIGNFIDRELFMKYVETATVPS